MTAGGRLVQNRKETAIYKRGNNIQSNTKTQNTQNGKKHTNNIKQHNSCNQKITNRSE